jgi:exonuclease VII small subunit
LIYDRLAGWLPNHDRAHDPKFVGGIMARVEITFAVYRPPIDDLPHLVVVLADGNVLLTEPVESFEEGEELVDHLSRELLKAAPPRG